MDNLEEILRAKIEAVDALASGLKARVDSGVIDSAEGAQKFVHTWLEAMENLLTTNR